DPTSIPASGKGGRLLKEDVQRYLEARPPQAAPSAAPRAPAAPASTPPPAVRTGPAPTPVVRSGAASPRVSPWSEGEEERAVPMSRIRQRIAERLVQAQHTAAILTTFNEVDMSAVMDLRGRFKESFEQKHGVRLSFMSFFTRACVLALQQIPEINAEIRGADLVYHRHVHMALSFQTDPAPLVPAL